MTKKIIALDLDGTLLNSDSQISDFTKETIKKVTEKGHQVIITTGRPYRMSKDFYRELGLDTPMINFNGSLTHLP
ncbi:HAD-IIB family hydrolase, partial [Streptococcus pneumoniae]